MLDPTREEMLTALAPFVSDYEADEFDVEEAVYWFAANYHGGQGSNLYAALSASRYSPGPTVRGPLGISREFYRDLEATFGGKGG